MAIVVGPTGKLTYDLLDETGYKGKTALHFPAATLIADVHTAAAALGDLMALITDCSILGYTVTYSARDTAPGEPIDGARVENKGVFVLNLANTLTSRLEVPGIKEAVLTPSGSIDVEADAVSDFLTAIITSPAIFRGIDASDIVSVRSAYQSFRRTTKPNLPSDRVKFGG